MEAVSSGRQKTASSAVALSVSLSLSVCLPPPIVALISLPHTSSSSCPRPSSLSSLSSFSIFISPVIVYLPAISSHSYPELLLLSYRPLRDLPSHPSTVLLVPWNLHHWKYISSASFVYVLSGSGLESYKLGDWRCRSRTVSGVACASGALLQGMFFFFGLPL